MTERGRKPDRNRKEPRQESDGNRTGKEAETGAGIRGSKRGAKGVEQGEVTWRDMA